MPSSLRRILPSPARRILSSTPTAVRPFHRYGSEQARTGTRTPPAGVADPHIVDGWCQTAAHAVGTALHTPDPQRRGRHAAAAAGRGRRRHHAGLPGPADRSCGRPSPCPTRGRTPRSGWRRARRPPPGGSTPPGRSRSPPAIAGAATSTSVPTARAARRSATCSRPGPAVTAMRPGPSGWPARGRFSTAAARRSSPGTPTSGNEASRRRPRAVRLPDPRPRAPPAPAAARRATRRLGRRPAARGPRRGRPRRRCARPLPRTGPDQRGSSTCSAHLARGESNRAIAAALGISENTVKNHVRSILEKLQATSRAEAVVIGLSQGLTSLPR